MADDQDGIGSLLKNRSIAFVLFTATTASILVTIYHLVSICFCNRQGAISRRDSLQRRRRRLSSSEQIITPGSADRILAAELIPSHKYWKGEGVAGGGEDGAVCAVCLGEFEEGEELRALPGCDHAFHAPCIDMWLFSHVTCPICRADATPSPRVCLTPETRLDLAEGLEDVVVNIDQSRRSLA